MSEGPQPASRRTVVLTVTLDRDKVRRLRELALHRGVSVSDLLDEFATMALFDAAASGFPTAADAHFSCIDDHLIAAAPGS